MVFGVVFLDVIFKVLAAGFMLLHENYHYRWSQMPVFKIIIKFEVWKWDQDLKSFTEPETNNCTPFLDFTISKCSHFPELYEVLCQKKSWWVLKNNESLVVLLILSHPNHSGQSSGSHTYVGSCSPPLLCLLWYKDNFTKMSAWQKAQKHWTSKRKQNCGTSLSMARLCHGPWELLSFSPLSLPATRLFWKSMGAFKNSSVPLSGSMYIRRKRWPIFSCDF